MSKIITQLGADTRGLKTGFDQARGEVRKFGADIKKTFIAAFAFQAVLSSFNFLIDKLDQVHKFALRMNEAPEAIQRIGIAAGLAKTGLGPLVNIMTRLERRVGEQISGIADHSKALDLMGVKAEEFIGLSMDEQLIKVSEGYAEAERKGVGLTAIMKFLDTEARDMIPLLRQGPEAIKESMNAANVASDEAVEQAAEFNDQLFILKTNAVAFFSPLIGVLLQVVNLWKTGINFAVEVFQARVERATSIILALKEAVLSLNNQGSLEAAGQILEDSAKRYEERINKANKQILSDLSDISKESQKLFGLRKDPKKQESTKKSNFDPDQFNIEEPGFEGAKGPSFEEVERDLKRLDALKRKNFLDQLNKQERLNELIKEQNDLRASGDIEALIRAEELESQIRSITEEIKRQKELDEQKRAKSVFELNLGAVSSLARVGGASGLESRANPMLAESEKQTKLQERMVKALESQDKLTLKAI